MATTDGSTVRSEDEVRGPAATAGRQRGLLLTLGILSIIIGILVIAHPINTLVFVSVLLGIQLVILGAVRIALAVSALAGGLRVAAIVLGVITILAGVVCFVRPSASLFIVALFLAAGWIADGIAHVIRAFSSRTAGMDKTWALLQGVLSLAAGILVALFPRDSLALLTQVAGVALLLIGLLTCVAALVRRGRTT